MPITQHQIRIAAPALRLYMCFVLLLAGPASAANFEGIWSTDRARSSILPDDPEFTVAGREALDNFDPERDDPALYCAIYMPRTMIAWGRNPMEIFQSEEQLWIVFERMHQVRRIFLDGRAPLEDEGPTWMGQSSGSWDGESLIVDTVSMRGEVFHWSGLPLSPETRVIERFTLLDEDTLEIMLTVTDPVNYETPWTTRQVWRLTPEVEFYEYECQ